MRNEPGKRPPQGAGKGIKQKKPVRINTKNEPVVGRNNFQRARPCKGAKLTPWIWIGGTKEVRALRNIMDKDPYEVLDLSPGASKEEIKKHITGKQRSITLIFIPMIQ